MKELKIISQKGCILTCLLPDSLNPFVAKIYTDIYISDTGIRFWMIIGSANLKEKTIKLNPVFNIHNNNFLTVKKLVPEKEVNLLRDPSRNNP